MFCPTLNKDFTNDNKKILFRKNRKRMYFLNR